MNEIKYKCNEFPQSIIRAREEVRRMKFEDFTDLPLFRDSMPEDYVPPELSEKEKESVDRICKWLFGDDEPMPEEAKQFIALMKVIHNE